MKKYSLYQKMMEKVNIFSCFLFFIMIKMTFIDFMNKEVENYE